MKSNTLESICRLTLKLLIFLLIAFLLGKFLKPKTYEVRPKNTERPVEHRNQKSDVGLLPALRPICGCESSYEGTAAGEPQQFEKDGVTVRRGRINPSDVGECQINEKIHGEKAKALGFDILTKIGNIAYANWLYKEQGTTPWNWSKSCWGKK